MVILFITIHKRQIKHVKGSVKMAIILLMMMKIRKYSALYFQKEKYITQCQNTTPLSMNCSYTLIFSLSEKT